MDEEQKPWDCVHCGASTPDADFDGDSLVDESTGWWNCPVCGACNGDDE